MSSAEWGEREGLVGLRHLVGCSTGPLTRAGNLGERDASPTDLEFFGRSPAFSPPSPLSLSLLDAGRSCADFLFGVRVALIGPLLLTYFFSEGTYRSALTTCQLKMEPLRHLRPLPSTTAGLRSTFDRLPYGCLLFMYRCIDLTSTPQPELSAKMHVFIRDRKQIRLRAVHRKFSL